MPRCQPGFACVLTDGSFVISGSFFVRFFQGSPEVVISVMYFLILDVGHNTRR